MISRIPVEVKKFCEFLSSRYILRHLVLACIGMYFMTVWMEGSISITHSDYRAFEQLGSALISPGVLEPAYIQLWPTISHLPCNLTLIQTGPLSGFLEHSGNCQGFIASVILINVESGHRQAAEIVKPNKINWRVPMEKITQALLTLYSNVLPDELLQEVEWVKNDTILYHPTIVAINASVIDQIQIAASMAKDGMNGMQRGDSIMWEKHIVRGLSRDFNLSCYHAAQFKNIWIVGTSESRRLFDHICSAIFSTTPILEKTTMTSQCGNIHFVNTCQWDCGCNFTAFFDSLGHDRSGQFISVSCGLHSEYLKGSSYLEVSLHALSDRAQRLKLNQTRVQFRVSNAVNPFKTVPQKLAIARNNFRYQMFRDMALSTLLASDVHIIDAFRISEPVFDLSEDHVHFPPWVYGELARIFLNSLCDVQFQI